MHFVFNANSIKMPQIFDYQRINLIYESYGPSHEKIFFDEVSGGFVVIHRKHGKNEAAQNLQIALMLAKNGEQMELIENDNVSTSADAKRNGDLWEFKTIKALNLRRAVQRELRKGKVQCSNILLFINQLYTIEEITLGIYNAVKFDNAKGIKKIAVLFQEGHLIEMTREEVKTKAYVTKFYQKTKEDEHSSEPPFW